MIRGTREIRVDTTAPDGSTELGRLIVGGSHPRLVKDSVSRAEFGYVESFRLLDLEYQHRLGNSRFLYPPLLTRTAPYSPTGSMTEDMYPPSSHGWITRMDRSGNPALYTLFGIAQSPDLLLVISDIASGCFHEAMAIKSFEAPILAMKTDFELHSDLQQTATSVSDYDPFGVLSGPSPRISNFESLVGEAGVPFIYHPDSFEATLDPLVPSAFPEEVRKEIKAFYANVVLGTMLQDDPLKLQQYLSKYGTLRDLAIGHVRCLKDGVKPPPYIQIFNEAADDKLGTGSVPLQGEIEAPQWMKGLFKILELFPSWFDRVKKYIDELTKAGTIPLRFPESAAEKSGGLVSQDSWKDRFAFAIHGLLMRAQVRQEVLGLKYVLYLGSAYRWPHKHTAWSSRFERKGRRPWYLQVMLMPPSAVSKVMNRIPGVIPIDRMVSRVNLQAFDDKTGTWSFSLARIYDSLSAKRTEKDFRREFRIRARERVVKIDQLEARVLGHAFFQLSLELMERGIYARELGITNERIRGILMDLTDRRVLTMRYNPSLFSIGKLFSIGIDVKGAAETINSFAREFLLKAPSATAFVADHHDYGIIVSRVPRNIVADLFGRLPEVAEEAGVKLRIWPVKAYSAYTHDIFSRLLLKSGQWDDDVGGLTSQSRSTSSEGED
jgi:hypothetical protein